MDAQLTEAELHALMVASLEGDGPSYERLLTAVSGRLRTYFGRRLIPSGRDASAVEDLVQDVLLALHTKRHTYDRRQLFTPWMYAIARYKLVDFLRRTKTSTQAVDLGSIKDLMTHGTQPSIESGIDLEKMMASLSPRVRQAIRYVKLDGMTVGEAAARSGRSPSAIKVSVHRGLKTLARAVRKESHQ